jgi:energy-coupling factor transporter transmembrane protein EcfT
MVDRQQAEAITVTITIAVRITVTITITITVGHSAHQSRGLLGRGGVSHGNHCSSLSRSTAYHPV